MITLQTITGLLIAAVLNVLGTGQHEVAQVENEPVVKEESALLNQDLWFLVTPTSIPDQEDQENQLITAALGEDVEPNCGGSSVICAVKLRIPATADPTDFENQSVADALSNGATAPPGGIQYDHQN